jgi:hypothetical protein
MPNLAAVTADLLRRPRPVLCLDTCDLLELKFFCTLEAALGSLGI